MNSGLDPSLIEKTECALAVNYTFRDGLAAVRPSLSSIPLTFNSTQTQNNFAGFFQGASFYQSAQVNQSGFIVSVAGRLFRIVLSPTAMVTEITPSVPLNTTGNFTVPNAGSQVNVMINSQSNVLPSGTTIYIAGGQFTVAVVTGNTLTLTYVSGYVAPTVAIQTQSAFKIPAVGSTVTVPVNNPGSLVATNTVYLLGGQYTINSITGNTMVLQNVTGVQGNMVLAYTPLQNNVGVNYTYSNYVVPSGTSITDASGNQLFFTATNPANLDFVDIQQGENYAVVWAGQNPTVIYDGSTARLAGVKELPPGLFGSYQWGRFWVVLNDRRSFVAGDLVKSSSGTPANNYVDAILKMTQNTFLNGGGTFTVPNNRGLISAIGGLPVLDTSLGIGQVVVGTTNSLIGVNAPADRTTWQNLSYPIQAVAALGYGPIGPRSLIPVNSDLWFRALDGMRSFQAKRRDFQKWSDTPQSREVDLIVNGESTQLLFYGSGLAFDNKLFHTVSPYLTPYGVLHRGLAVLNFDLISDLRMKTPPSWEGVITGLQILQVVFGVVDGAERAFIFASNQTGSGLNGQIELWEINEDGEYDIVNGAATIGYKAVASQLESRRDDFGAGEQLKALYTAELYLDEIVDNVSLTIKWRPDQYPTWTTWETLNFCATQQQCILSKVTVLVTGAGAAAANGTYNQTGTTTYVAANGYAIYLAAPNTWILATAIGGPGIQLYGNTSLLGPWSGFSLQNPPPTVSAGPVTQCSVVQENAAQYAARVLLTAPPEVINALTNGYLHEGYEFQFRFEGTGHFRIRKFKAHAKVRSDRMEGEVQTTTCQALPVCNLPVFNYDSHV